MRGRRIISGVAGLLAAATVGASGFAQELDLTEFLLRSPDVAMPVTDGADLALAQPLGETALWDETFTLRGLEDSIPVGSMEYEGLTFTAGDRFGVSLGIDFDDSDPTDFDDVSAAAFYNWSPRLSFGGQVSLSTERAELFNDPTTVDEEEAPEVKILSYFRF